MRSLRGPQAKAVKAAEAEYRKACEAETAHPCKAHAQATDVAARAVYRAKHP